MAAIKIAIEQLLFLLVDLQFRLKLHPLCLVRLDKHGAEYAVVIEIFRHGHLWVVWLVLEKLLEPSQDLGVEVVPD